MPHQKGDPPFGETELLFRRVAMRMVQPDGTVTADAVPDVPPGTSVDRQRFSTVEEAYERALVEAARVAVVAADVAIVAVAFGDLPDIFVVTETDVRCECLVEYLPTPADDVRPANSAHSEIRVRKCDESEMTKKLKNGALKAKIRSDIAETMRLVYPPRR